MSDPSNYWNDLGALQTRHKVVVQQRDMLLRLSEAMLAAVGDRSKINWPILAATVRSIRASMRRDES